VKLSGSGLPIAECGYSTIFEEVMLGRLFWAEGELFGPRFSFSRREVFARRHHALKGMISWFFKPRLLSKIVPLFSHSKIRDKMARMRSNDPLVWIDCEVSASTYPFSLQAQVYADDRLERRKGDHHVDFVLHH